jgi:hypothetical protein
VGVDHAFVFFELWVVPDYTIGAGLSDLLRELPHFVPPVNERDLDHQTNDQQSKKNSFENFQFLIREWLDLLLLIFYFSLDGLAHPHGQASAFSLLH